jgi:hypothetical protein
MVMSEYSSVLRRLEGSISSVQQGQEWTYALTVVISWGPVVAVIVMVVVSVIVM